MVVVNCTLLFPLSLSEERTFLFCGFLLLLFLLPFFLELLGILLIAIGIVMSKFKSKAGPRDVLPYPSRSEGN